ncbi:MAG: protein translocase subunit SecD [Phycisphaerales bacterium]|nr:protein translocase subunit SecD [Phycisphaerales bacterium]
MRHFTRNSIIAIVMLALAFWASNPPSEKIGLGKDLRGGASLVYSVQIDRTESASQVIPQVIEVLKKRIDPNGLYEIQIVSQGQDRIEITMPLPSEFVKSYRKAFEDELDKLGVASIKADKFERVMALEPDERAQEIQRLGANSPKVLDLLNEAAQAYDDAERFRSQLEIMSLNQDTPEEIIDNLIDQAADAELAYEAARDTVLDSAVSPEDVRRALELSTEQKTIKDEANDQYIPLPSERERALTRIRERYPDLSDQLDRVIESYDVYSQNRNSLDDTSDLKRLVQAAGVLSFRITAEPSGTGNSTYAHPDEQRLREKLRTSGPTQASSRDARWFKLNKLESWFDSVEGYESMIADPASYFASRYRYVVEEYEGNFYMLCWDARGLRMTQADGRWKVESSRRSVDQLGRPAIGFTMDAAGANRLGDLTGPNTGANMAVLLDDEVYTAPRLNSRISKSGIIEGDFSPEEIDYVVRVLTAGSLQAKISAEPISENTIAPDLGQDNLDAGVRAGIIALVVVSIFMVLYYLGYGLVAVLCLSANALLILGALALSRASLTLPGIAGIILTFGMAVDANVLIYERIREEIYKGLELRQAVKVGYQKALSSIVDGNVTNLIVCFVLANVGTQEIKGFAITLGIGVICTMISALFINHLIMSTLVDKIRIKKMVMLPTVIQPLERLLKPNINWMGLRWVCLVISVCYVGLGISMIIFQGEKMLDTEFRGGTQVTMNLKHSDPNDSTSDRITSTRAEIEERVKSLGEEVGEDSSIRALRSAEIIPVDPQADGITSDKFIVKTFATDRQAVGNAISAEFQDMLDAPPALNFRYSTSEQTAGASVYPVLTARLGENIARPEYRNSIPDFVGGVAILVEDLEPTPSLESLESRLDITRRKTDFSDLLGRQSEIIILEGDPNAVRSFAYLSSTEDLTYFDNADAWESEIASREWDLIRAALTTASDQLSVQNFSPAIAENFRATAFAAVLLSLLLILIYIWVRFGSVRYSGAAIAALTHDVLTTIGLIALAEIIYDHHIFTDLAQTLLIEPFKIDLNLVAAMLTIIGYSLNDSIVIMDRIRENRGKLSYASREVINQSINETISRTVITSGTTLFAVLILYIYGGQGVRAFSFALLVGVLIGTYSSIAVAAPLVWSRKKDTSKSTMDEMLEIPEG